MSAGSIEVRQHGVEVLEAPPRALITLELLNKAGYGLTVEGDKITIGAGDFRTVTYQVVGWEVSPVGGGALVVERVDPPLTDDEWKIPGAVE